MTTDGKLFGAILTGAMAVVTLGFGLLLMVPVVVIWAYSGPGQIGRGLMATSLVGGLIGLSIVVFVAYGFARTSWRLACTRSEPAARPCPSCGYDLAGSVGGVCPECGRAQST